MICPACGGRWLVVDSRTPDTMPKLSGNRYAKSSAAFNRAEPIMTWYTDDFQARKRKCADCGHIDYTVELVIDDLKLICSLIALGDDEAISSMAKSKREAKIAMKKT